MNHKMVTPFVPYNLYPLFNPDREESLILIYCQSFCSRRSGSLLAWERASFTERDALDQPSNQLKYLREGGKELNYGQAVRYA